MPRWLIAFGRWLLERLFEPVVLSPDSLERLQKAAARGTLLYVARTLSLLEFWCWRHILTQAGLPLPVAVHGLTRRASPTLFSRLLGSGRAVFYFLRKGQRVRAPQGFDGQYETAFLAAATGANGRPVLAVPLLLVWRDATMRDSTRPWLELVLGAQEEPRTGWRLFQLLRRRNRAEAIVAEPIDLGALAQETSELRPEVSARRLRFELSGAIERARRTRLGPPRKSTRRLRQEILRSRRMRTALDEAARDMGHKTAALRAKAYLREVAANMKPWFLLVARRVLARVFRRIYEGVEVDMAGLERLRAAAHKGPLILVPSHRSHVDYLVLTYVLTDYGIAPPLIAAGANLSFFPLGFLFRRGGAFFLRRSFGGNRLYTAVFREYVRKMLKEGYSIEFFIEGGRSRTGKLLQPKLGLMGIIVDVVAAGEVKGAQVVPISIAYDKVIEERAYADELSGGEKKREDLGAFLRVRHVLASNYGRLYLNFDEPFALDDEMVAIRESETRDGEGDPGRRLVVQRIAHRVLWGITRSSVVTPTALVAAALLATGRRGVARDAFVQNARYLLARARAASAAGAGGRLAASLMDEADDLPVTALDRAIELLQADGDLQIRGTAGAPMVVIPEERRLHLDYYRNSALHALVAEALLATALLAVRQHGEGDEMARQRTLELSRLLKNEFVYEVGRPFGDIFDRTWERLQEDGTLDDPKRLRLLAGLVRDFVESYVVTAMGLASKGGHTNERELLELGERLYLEGTVTRREALSKSNFSNALDALRAMDPRGVQPEVIRYFLVSELPEEHAG